MLLAIAILVIIPAIGGFYLTRGKSKSLDRLKFRVDDDIRKRLASIAEGCKGKVIAGPALETGRGLMVLVASKAPENMVVDLAKFSSKTASNGAMTVVRIEDAGKVIATKHLRPLTLKDSRIAERYRVLVSDETRGQTWMTQDFAAKLQALETAVRARCRIQMANGTVTIMAFRGLAKSEELQAFYDGSVAVLDALEAAAAAS